MAGFQLPFNCSQDEDYVGAKKFFSPPIRTESAFKTIVSTSLTATTMTTESEPQENNMDVGGKEVRDHKDCQIVEPTKKGRSGPPKRKTPIKKRAKTVKVEEEDTEEEKKKNWLDSEFEQLISIQDEMHAEFERNAKKKGVDTWICLRAQMLATILGYFRAPEACRKKFDAIFKSYK